METDWVECTVEGCTTKTSNGDCLSCWSLRLAREARERNKVTKRDHVTGGFSHG